jgi:hypothetical protein
MCRFLWRPQQAQQHSMQRHGTARTLRSAQVLVRPHFVAQYHVWSKSSELCVPRGVSCKFFYALKNVKATLLCNLFKVWEQAHVKKEQLPLFTFSLN